MVAEYLAFRGFAVQQAPNGTEALALARKELPRIILMDLSMPGVDGWEATPQLKADPTTRDAIVIAVTAHALTPDEPNARKAGCDGFVAKPFDLSALADGLARVMRNGRRALGSLSKSSGASRRKQADRKRPARVDPHGHNIKGVERWNVLPNVRMRPHQSFESLRHLRAKLGFRVDRLAFDGTVKEPINERSDQSCSVEDVPVMSANLRDAAIQLKNLALEQHDRYLGPLLTVNGRTASWPPLLVKR